VAWADRPQASRLLAEVAADGRRFDAVVVGEYERAFAGQQLAQLAPVLRRYGVALWLPETYGPVDFDSPRQLALLDLLGVRSQREVSRARFRTMAAMRVQAEAQGRHLGGRPPYGYRLVDAGPHPNQVHAGWGRRLHRLDPDPVTGPHVRWIFGQRLAGRSMAGIARELNERGVPCPSKADRDRNRHRSGEAWQVTTVAAILSNPRYTGRQVWNRQPANRNSPDRQDEPIPGLEVRSRASSAQWAISRQVVHPPLVTEEQFVRVQAVHTAPVPTDGFRRTYLLAGVVVCGICGRALDSHWLHDGACYRCRHGRTSGQPTSTSQAKWLYVREDHLLARVLGDRRLRRLLPDLADATGVAAVLQANDMVIVCEHDAWAVESAVIRIDLAPVSDLGFAMAAAGPERPGP
jgi:DNA invertase Pin-like site-specific DNA recombinase